MANYKDKLPIAIIQRCEDKLDWCMSQLENKWKDAWDRFPALHKRPNMTFDKRGVSAGSAHAKKWQIKLNKVFLLEQTEDMVEDTIPHEFAHLVVRIVYPKVTRHHGREWKFVCRMLFGKELDTYHAYCAKNARVHKAPLVRYRYTCQNECAISTFTKGKHERIKTWIEMETTAGYYCRKCHTRIDRFIGMILVPRDYL